MTQQFQAGDIVWLCKEQGIIRVVTEDSIQHMDQSLDNIFPFTVSDAFSLVEAGGWDVFLLPASAEFDATWITEDAVGLVAVDDEVYRTSAMNGPHWADFLAYWDKYTDENSLIPLTRLPITKSLLIHLPPIVQEAVEAKL